MEINIDINDNGFTVNFFKNQEEDKFVPLLYIRIQRPIIYLMMENNFSVYQVSDISDNKFTFLSNNTNGLY